jgi:non-specific serine/threonine protein kinase/serine/threonine-protein kinase
MENHADSQFQISSDGVSTVPPSKETGWVAEGAGFALDGATPAPPANIGQYRILRLLGEGGMGTVYEAEQQRPRRAVALKVIKPGFAGPELRRRFEYESWALGRLHHPGIAQIYEAGTADTGMGPQPYFAMEFVHGQPLRDYAEAKHLNLRQRLGLMLKICEAVHHAHQQGLIHRDLKPGNILVDGTGQPRILDFGVACATDIDAPVTLETDLGQLVGTLAYMSPEQTLGDRLEIDVRSDVYSVGLVLYELLAGRPPYYVGKVLHKAVQTIREEEPAPLSSVDRRYRGDVETIVAKALEKEKARRYGSAAELAADIRRYLQDEPIVARPPSTTYQLRKFARRHKALVTGMAAVFVVLSGGVAASTWQAARATQAQDAAILAKDRATAAERRAIEERNSALSSERAATEAKAEALRERNRAVSEKRRADIESATAKAVNDFLRNDLLAEASSTVQARPGTKPDPDLKVRTALDRADARIDGKFAGQPAVEASIRVTIAASYQDLGLYPQAQRELERAIDLRRRTLGEKHPDTLASIGDLATLHVRAGKWEQAEALFGKLLEVRLSSLGEQHPDTLTTMNGLAGAYLNLGKYAQAIPLLTKAMGGRLRVLGEENRDTLDSMNTLAGVYYKQGDFPKAEALLVRILAVDRRALGEHHPDTLRTMNNLAMIYGNEGKYSEREPLLVQVLEERRSVLGNDHPETLVSMSNLAVAYEDSGKYSQAEPLLAAAVEARSRVLGADNPQTLVSMNNLAAMYRDEGRYAEAESLYGRVVESQRRVLGPEHPNTLAAMNGLAQVFLGQGRQTEAEALLTSTLDIRRRVLGSDHPATTSVLESLGEIRLLQDRYADAEVLFREALANREKRRPDGWERYQSESLLGASLEGQGKYAEAEPLLVSGYQGIVQRGAAIPFEHRDCIQRSGERIVRLYEKWGKPEKAVEWRGNLEGKPAGAGRPKSNP